MCQEGVKALLIDINKSVQISKTVKTHQAPLDKMANKLHCEK